MLSTIERLVAGNNGLAYTHKITIPLSGQTGSINLSEHLKGLVCTSILGFFIACQNEAGTRCNEKGELLATNDNLSKMFVDLKDKDRHTLAPKLSLEWFAVDPKCCNKNVQNVYWNGIDPSSCITIVPGTTFAENTVLEIIINYCKTQ